MQSCGIGGVVKKIGGSATRPERFIILILITTAWRFWTFDSLSVSFEVQNMGFGQGI